MNRKKITKIAVIISTALLMVVGTFSMGVYAVQNGWLEFTGGDQVRETEDDIEEIMEILDEVYTDKLTAQEALEKLEELDPRGLKEENINLRDKLKTIQEDIVDRNNRINQLERDIVAKDEEIQIAETELQAEKNSNYKNEEYIDHLEEELKEANEKVTELREETQNALEKARGYVN